MGVFNADTYREPWRVVLQGHTYTARPVSTEGVATYLEAHAASLGRPDGSRQRTRALERLLRLGFPWQVSYRWRRREDPVWLLQQLDSQTLQAALADFFAYLGILAPTGSPTTTRPGPTSPRTSALASSSAEAAADPSGTSSPKPSASSDGTGIAAPSGPPPTM